MSEVAAADGAEATPADAGAAATPEAGADAAAAASNDVSWRESITDEGARKLAERYNTFDEFAKGAAEKDRMISQRPAIPGEGASEEELAKYHKAIGVPETVEGYAIAKPEHMADEDWSNEGTQALVNSVLESAHTAGATKAQVDAIMTPYFKAMAEAEAQVARDDAAHAEAAEEQLRTDWGSDYKQNMAYAEKVVAQTPGLAEMTLRDGSLLGNHPLFARMAAQLGRLTSEGAPQVGLMGSEAGVDMQTRHAQLTREIYEANLTGDRSKAQELDAERRQISERLRGTKSIRGG